MFRTLLVCAVVSASLIGCATTPPRQQSQPPVADKSTGPKRTYSQKDIEGTGQTNVGDALQMLDPSITVHH